MAVRAPIICSFSNRQSFPVKNCNPQAVHQTRTDVLQLISLCNLQRAINSDASRKQIRERVWRSYSITKFNRIQRSTTELQRTESSRDNSPSKKQTISQLCCNPERFPQDCASCSKQLSGLHWAQTPSAK